MCWLGESVQASGLARVCLVWRDGSAELWALVSVPCSFSPSTKLVVSEFQGATEKTMSGMYVVLVC